MLNIASSTQQSADLLGQPWSWKLSPDSKLGLVGLTSLHGLTCFKCFVWFFFFFFLVVSGGILNLVPVIPSRPAVGHLICIFSHAEGCSDFKQWKVFHGPVVLTPECVCRGCE